MPPINVFRDVFTGQTKIEPSDYTPKFIRDDLEQIAKRRDDSWQQASQTPPPPSDDPFAGLSGIPQALKGVGDVVGPIFQGAAEAPVIGGALNALSWLDSTLLRTPVGVAALGADVFVQTGLRDRVAERMRREGIPQWEAGRVATEELDTALQKIAENEGEEGAARFLAQTSRAVNLGGSLVAPIAPGARGAAALGRRITGTSVPALGADELARRAGAVPPTEARAARTYADVGPEQQAAVQDFARQVEERRPSETLPLESEIARAVEAKERRMSRLMVRVAQGKATAAEADEIASYLESKGAPSNVITPLRRIADEALETQARFDAEGEAAAQLRRQEYLGERATFRAVERETGKALTRERRSGDAVRRAEDALRRREERLMTITEEETARLARRAEAQRIVRETVPADEVAAEVRLPKALDQELAAIERRLEIASPDAAGTATPAKFAQALRAEAKRARRQTRTLPKRGLIGERVVDNVRGQSARQEQYGSGLVPGRTQYRATGDRVALETRATELEALAKRIDAEIAVMRDARRWMIDERKKLAAGSDEERFLLRTSAAYRQFLGVGDIDQVGINAAQVAIDEASSRLHAVIREAEDQGVRPALANKAGQLIADLRADMAILRSSIGKTLSGEEPEVARLRQSVLGSEDSSAAAEISAARARLDEADLTTTTISLGDAPFKADMGYAAPRDEALLAEFGFNSGKQSSVISRAMLAETIRANADEFRARRARVSNDELLNEWAPRVAAKIGMDEEAFKAMIPKRGELAGFLIVADATLDRSARTLGQAARALKNGTMPQEAFDEVWAKHLALHLDISEGGSEVARAQASRRIVKEPGVADALAAKRRVEVAEKDMGAAEIELDRSAAALKVAEDQAEAAAMKADASSDPVRAGEVRLESSKRVQAAREAVAKAKARVDEAVDAHRTAVESAAEATARYQSATITKAIRSGMDKDSVTVLAQLDPENVWAVHDFFRNQHHMSKPEWAISWALSNSYGSVVSLQNNFINTGLRVLARNFVHRPMAAVAGKAVERALGQTVIAPAEVTQAWVGMWRAAPDAFQFFARTVLNGEAPEIALKYRLIGITEESAQKYGVGQRPLVKGNKGLLFEAAYRFLGGADGFWRVLDASAESRALIARDGWNAGLRGDDLGSYVAEKMRNVDPKILDRAATVSLKSTFNNPAEVGSLTYKMLRLINHRFGGNTPFLRLALPAARFGINATKHMANLSGFGLVKGAFLVKKLPKYAGEEAIDTAREAAMAFSEGSLGAALIYVANEMYEDGLLTGEAPRNEAERRVWETTHRPSSLLIGGQWVPLWQFGPMAAPFMFTAAIRDAIAEGGTMDDQRIERMVQRGAGAIGRVLMDSPAFEGTYRMLNAVYSLTEGGQAAEREVSTLLSRFLPMSGTLRSLVGVWDENERDPEGIIERLQGRVPGLSKQVPARLDQFGRVVKRPLSGLAAIGPTQASAPGTPDPVEADMAAHGYTVGFAGDSIGNQKLTAEERETYLLAAGTETYRRLNELIQSRQYQTATDERERASLRDKIIRDSREQARSIIADNALHASRRDDEIVRAVRMRLSLMSNASLKDEAYFVEKLDDQGKLTPTVAQAIDAQRGSRPDGSRKPTVAEYLRRVPQIHFYFNLPPYRVGNKAEWERLRQARAAAAQYAEATGKPPGVADWLWYYGVDAEAANLIRLYSRASLRDPRRVRMLDEHPGLRPFLESTVPIQTIPQLDRSA